MTLLRRVGTGGDSIGLAGMNNRTMGIGHPVWSRDHRAGGVKSNINNLPNETAKMVEWVMLLEIRKGVQPGGTIMICS
jgi:citrate synthase